MAAPLFQLDGLTLTRSGRIVLDSLCASIPEGSSAVAGPSGCGKSTLLRLLNRLADPDEGSVRLRGRDLRDLDPLELRRDVCLVPQLPALLDGTVEANLRFAGRLGGAQVHCARLLDLAGLDESYAGREAGRLSVGEQQRVMLARALALEPSVLLLDEPTSALDEDARASVERRLQELRRRLNVSLVLVTHDSAQAERMADFVLRLDDGRSAAPAEPAAR